MEKTIREACIALASHTGWSLSEMKEMDSEEFIDWIDSCPKEND